MAGYYYGIDPSTYLIPDGTGSCSIGLMDYGAEAFLIGNVFQKGYYSIYDDENSRMAFIPHN